MPMTPIREFQREHRFLSNFWPVPEGVLIPEWDALPGQEGLRFPTVEHAYVAAKSLDAQERQTAADMPTAGGAKRLGSRIALRSDWAAVRPVAMASLLTQKFAAGTLLAGLLVATEDAELVEGNDWCDVYWGVCSCPVHCPSGDPADAQGSNLLGSMLMARRSRLAALAATESQPGDPVT